MNISLQSDDVRLMQEIAVKVTHHLKRADLTSALHAADNIVLTAVDAGRAVGESVGYSSEG